MNGPDTLTIASRFIAALVAERDRRSPRLTLTTITVAADFGGGGWVAHLWDGQGRSLVRGFTEAGACAGQIDIVADTARRMLHDLAQAGLAATDPARLP